LLLRLGRLIRSRRDGDGGGLRRSRSGSGLGRSRGGGGDGFGFVSLLLVGSLGSEVLDPLGETVAFVNESGDFVWRSGKTR
jgi:hypothetical protein